MLMIMADQPMNQPEPTMTNLDSDDLLGGQAILSWAMFMLTSNWGEAGWDVKIHLYLQTMLMLRCGDGEGVWWDVNVH